MSTVLSGRWSLMSSSSWRKRGPLTLTPRGYQLLYQVDVASASTALLPARIPVASVFLRRGKQHIDLSQVRKHVQVLTAQLRDGAKDFQVVPAIYGCRQAQVPRQQAEQLGVLAQRCRGQLQALGIIPSPGGIAAQIF